MMDMAARIARRRRLVLGALADGPADTATVARTVGGRFYDVHGVLDDLLVEGAVEFVGEARRQRWALTAERPPDEVAGARVNPSSRHEPPIGTSAAGLEPVHNPVDKSVHNGAPALCTDRPVVVDTGYEQAQTRTASGLAALMNMRTGAHNNQPPRGRKDLETRTVTEGGGAPVDKRPAAGLARQRPRGALTR